MSARKSPYAGCPRCGAHLIWARTMQGKWMPLDRAEDPQGSAAAMQSTSLVWHVRLVAPEERLHPPWKRYGIHDPACAEVSGTPEAAGNVTQLDTWRKAQSAHNAAQRRNRWKRAGPGITGYRVNPPT